MSLSRILIIAAGAGLLMNATAQARPSTLSMTCGQAQALVARQGAIVLSTGEFTYDRYVSDRRFCEVGEALRNEFVPTRDNPQCFVGYSCFTPSYHDGFRF
jgi:hypothetical protein